MSDAFVDDGDLDVTAAQYVIGTLDAAERTGFAERLRHDAAARAAVAAWDRRLAGLTASIAPIDPPAHIWTRIEQALENRAAVPQRLRVIEGGGRTEIQRPDFKASRDRWRLGALLSGAAAAALMVFVGAQELRRAAPPVRDASRETSYVAAVNRGGDKPALLVRVDLKTREVFVRPVAAETPTGRSLELWYIADGKPPRSMGTFDQAPEKLSIPRGSAAAEAATFAVSVEPPGGSKTGAPTGPVVYSGQLVAE